MYKLCASDTPSTSDLVIIMCHNSITQSSKICMVHPKFSCKCDQWNGVVYTMYNVYRILDESYYELCNILDYNSII